MIIASSLLLVLNLNLRLISKYHVPALLIYGSSFPARLFRYEPFSIFCSRIELPPNNPELPQLLQAISNLGKQRYHAFSFTHSSLRMANDPIRARAAI